MTEEQAIKYIQLALPADKAASAEYAERLLPAAISAVARLNGTTFNTIEKTFVSVAGQSVYAIGVDIFGAQSGIFGVEGLWITDVPSREVKMVGRDVFRSYKASSPNMSTFPTHGTIYRKEDLTYALELWPTPDAVYNFTCQAHLPLKFTDIPDLYHDFVVKEAILQFRAMSDSNILTSEIGRDRRDAMADSTTPWSGSIIRVDKPLGRLSSSPSADKFNLIGE